VCQTFFLKRNTDFISFASLVSSLAAPHHHFAMAQYDDLGHAIRITKGSVRNSILVGILVLFVAAIWLGVTLFIVATVLDSTYSQRITLDANTRLVCLHQPNRAPDPIRSIQQWHWYDR
jgi:hypothetical protein